MMLMLLLWMELLTWKRSRCNEGAWSSCQYSVVVAPLPFLLVVSYLVSYPSQTEVDWEFDVDTAVDILDMTLNWNASADWYTEHTNFWDFRLIFSPSQTKLNGRGLDVVWPTHWLSCLEWYLLNCFDVKYVDWNSKFVCLRQWITLGYWVERW